MNCDIVSNPVLPVPGRISLKLTIWWCSTIVAFIILGLVDKGCEHDHSSGGEDLTAAEIAEFELNRTRIREERIVLREKIRKDFEQLCGKNDTGIRNDLLIGKHEDGAR